MESLGNTQQRAGEKTIKGEMGGGSWEHWGAESEAGRERSVVRSELKAEGWQWKQRRKEKWSEEQYNWEQRGARKFSLAEE